MSSALPSNKRPTDFQLGCDMLLQSNLADCHNNTREIVYSG